MPVVVLKQLMVHVVISSGAYAQHSEHWVERMRILTMDEAQVIAINSTKSSIAPHVSPHDVCGQVKGYQNHADGVHKRTIESIKQTRGLKYVVRLMAFDVKISNIVLAKVHDCLEKVNDKKLQQYVKKFDGLVQIIIRLWHQIEYPGN